MQREEKVDLRVQKTERALVDAMIKLLREKPYEAISISDLCDTAMVRRATFYRHFKDKDDFFDFCLEQRRKRFEADWQTSPSADPLVYYTESMRVMLRYMRENEPLYVNTVCKSDRRDMRAVMVERFMQAIENEAHGLGAQVYTTPVPTPVMAAFLSGGLLGIGRWWCVDKPDMSEDLLVEYVHGLLSTCLQPAEKTTTSNTTPKEETEGDHER